ncbi:hypothetical protein BZG36_03731 [Bifiguratus adelaidae]|uniref:phenylalanine--tRNA ligase n=1 Tax=Bifiguratus adelaidae TaxID=1938954 RepID=A0A261XZE4_9FUNG|nr:hypothetical protein BZG36_03731 [Bifiguratus adelaidae]
MPTVNVDKEDLLTALGKRYTTEEFDELCFQFGVELEEDTSQQEIAEKQGAKILDGISDRPLYKIDIPANRYDLLCAEGISRGLLVFQGKIKAPLYKAVPPKNGPMHEIRVHPETAKIRPYVVGAILRNIHFTQARYDSFIDLQDKLHNNICRKRTLASMGTHDLDTIQGPFTYEALPPKDIQFVPLNQTERMNGNRLMEFYTPDRHLGKFLHIIRDSPVYPVIFDANHTVCSLPPIINSEHSKIKLTTKNVFIEITATDKTKASIALNTLVCMFSEYCEDKFTVEPVKVVYPDHEEITPDLESREMSTSVEYIKSCTGLNHLSPTEITQLLIKMALEASVNESNPDEISLRIPPTRADVLHSCDVMEDVAIAYGYDNLPRRLPAVSTFGAPFPINKLSDAIRLELALSGFTEVMTLTLCSHDENFAFLRKKDDGKTAVKLANPKTIEYQVIRTSLLPGILKTIESNLKHSLPIKVFEVSDVVFKDDSMDRLSRNERHVAAAYADTDAGFDIIHGLLHRSMTMLHARLVDAKSNELGYFVTQADHPTFFCQSGDIHLRYVDPATQKPVTKVIGAFGWLHPEVLQSFDIPYPISYMEFNLEPFL